MGWGGFVIGVICAVPAIILFLAGAAKLPDRRLFSSQIKAYDVLPERLVTPASVAVPIFEIAAGIGFFAVPAVGGFGSAVLYTGFGGAMVANLFRGRRFLRCGCFGASGGRRISSSHALLNMCAAAVCIGWAGWNPAVSFRMVLASISLTASLFLIFRVREIALNLKSSISQEGDAV